MASRWASSTLAICLATLIPALSRAQQIDAIAVCGGPDEALSDRSRVSLERQAEALATSPDPRLEAEHQVTRILVDPRRTDLARELHYLMSIACVLIITDHGASTDQKLAKIFELRNLLQVPTDSAKLGDLRQQLTSTPGLTAGNTASFAGNGRWNWTVYIAGAPQQIGAVQCVVYHLHPTFPNPDQRVCNAGADAAHAFPLTASGWGTFTVAIDVEAKDGSITRILHPLQFS